VLPLAARLYHLEAFDGRTFALETAIPMNHGPDGYASQSWSDAPGGHRIFIRDRAATGLAIETQFRAFARRGAATIKRSRAHQLGSVCNAQH